MDELTITGLKAIMRRCAGEDETVNLDGDILDVSFTELGYDSLALLETAAHIKRDYAIPVADHDLEAVETPGELLDLVNSYLVRL